MANDYELYIGSHVSMSGPEYFLGSVKEAISYGSNTFMFYTGAPQNSFRVPLERCKIAEGRKLLEENGFKYEKLVVHAPYILNIANKVKPDLFEVSKKHLIDELVRSEAFGASILVLHPGAHVGQGTQEGLNNIVEALDDVFSKDGTQVKIALETMAGKGSELGATFEEVQFIISHSKYPERLGVCFDTCHVNDEGLDLSKFDEVLAEFDRIIGLDKLLCLHINDTKNPIGAHKDRHENIGYGYLGFDTLNYIVHHEKLNGIPKILETPYVGEKPPYKKEIEMFKAKQFEPGWREKL